MNKCGICDGGRPDAELVVVHLTEEERQSVRPLVDQDTFHYCKPCWALMKRPEQALALLTGSLEMGLRQAEVPDATQRARAFRDFLLRLPRVQ